MTRAARVAYFAACAALCFIGACQQTVSDNETPTITFNADTGSSEFGVVDITPIDPALLSKLRNTSPSADTWPEIFAVFTGDTPPSDASVLPVLGTYQLHADGVRFTFRFPPVPGQPYYARFDRARLRRWAGVTTAEANSAVIDTTFLVQRAVAEASTSVVAVYPSTDRVPVNLLRLYINFSAPMSIGEAYDRIRLLDANANQVEDAFLVVGQELWDPERERLTLLFDPGRIKRDLRPHEEAGMPLREGGSYTLVVDHEWPDAQGLPLVTGFEKRFVVGPADRTSPRTADWKLTPPATPEAPLVLEFPEALDFALLERLLLVKSASGQPIGGEPAVSDNEMRWHFTPAEPWRAGAYVIEIGTALEDLAGNNLKQLFDRARANAPPTVTAERVTIPFVVRAR